MYSDKNLEPRIKQSDIDILKWELPTWSKVIQEPQWEGNQGSTFEWEVNSRTSPNSTPNWIIKCPKEQILRYESVVRRVMRWIGHQGN